MTAASKATAIAEWRENWTVVLAAFFGAALAAIYAYSIGVMIAPLEKEFGWSRAQISSGMLVVSIFSVVLSLFMGMAIDRFGPRRLALVGVLFYCGALALLSQATSSIYLWWFLWALIATGIMFIKPTIWVAAISSLFTASRGLALAVVLSATGFISFFMPMLTLALVENFGWRSAYLFLGGGAALVAFPLIYLFFSSAKDKERRTPTTDNAVPVALTGLSVREGLTSANFYLLAIAGLAMSLASVAISINIVPILVDDGLTAATAAPIAGIIGITQILGRLAGGYLLDRFNARIVAAISVALPIVTCSILLASSGSVPAAMVAAAFLGFAAGAEFDAVAYLCSKCFGMKKFGTLFGAFTGIISLGFGLGPMTANFVYDQTGSYDPVLWAIIPLTILSSVLFLFIGSYPDFERSSGDGSD